MERGREEESLREEATLARWPKTKVIVGTEGTAPREGGVITGLTEALDQGQPSPEYTG